MSVYRLDADSLRKHSSYKWKLPLAFAGFICLAIAGSQFDAWQNGVLDMRFIGLIGAVFSAAAWFGLRGFPQTMMRLRISITLDGISRTGGWQKDIFLSRDEITGFAQHEEGLLVCTADQMRSIQIPIDLESFSECRAELIGMSIPQTPWKENAPEWNTLFLVGAVLLMGVWLLWNGNDSFQIAIAATAVIGVLVWIVVEVRRSSRSNSGFLYFRLIIVFLAVLLPGLAHALHPILEGRYLNLSADLLIVLGLSALLKLGLEARRKKRG